MTRKIAILGATGSIGKSTLDLVEREPDRFQVEAVTAGTNVSSLAEIARRTRARLAVIADETQLGELQTMLAGTGCRAAAGDGALVEAATSAEMIIAAIVGCAGLEPTMAAVEAGQGSYVAGPKGRVFELVLLRAGLAKARYDSLDGYDWHPRQDRYRRADANNPEFIFSWK